MKKIIKLEEERFLKYQHSQSLTITYILICFSFSLFLGGATFRPAPSGSVRRRTDPSGAARTHQRSGRTPHGQYIRCPCGGRTDVRPAVLSRTDAGRTSVRRRTDAGRTPDGHQIIVRPASVRRPHGRPSGRFNCPCGRTDAARTPHGQRMYSKTV